MFEKLKCITRKVHTEWRFLSREEMPSSPYLTLNGKTQSLESGSYSFKR